MNVLRNPLLPVGLFLVILGFGNWYTGHDKSIEYERLLGNGNLPSPVEDVEDFRELNERTSATLLGSLQSGSDEYTVANAKLDFYKVVQSGGRMFILLGLFCAAAGLIRSRYPSRRVDRSVLPTRTL